MGYWGDLTITDRVKAIVEAERRAFEQTGEHTTYLCNVTDRPDRMIDNAREAVEAGGQPGLCSHRSQQALARLKCWQSLPI